MLISLNDSCWFVPLNRQVIYYYQVCSTMLSKRGKPLYTRPIPHDDVLDYIYIQCSHFRIFARRDIAQRLLTIKVK